MPIDSKKLEYIIDIFKGTCELNNYENYYLSIMDGTNIRDSLYKVAKKELTDKGKYYFTGPYFDDEEKFGFGIFLKEKYNPYLFVECINLAMKFLYNLGIEGSKITLGKNAASKISTEEVIDNLENLELPFEKDVEIESDEYFDLSFSITVEGSPVIKGGLSLENETIYAEIEYDDIEDLVEPKLTTYITDAYVLPKSEQVYSEALLIATDLRDSGFKVEVDYSLKNDKQIDAQFLITFDEKDIQKFRVKLIDLKTKEEKEVAINNLIEEISFI
ncbi:MAG: hypothetical protein HFG33_00895 [Bacilli bacterium]|nr:hypothetical protein [Bacilli bacterium]